MTMSIRKFPADQYERPGHNLNPGSLAQQMRVLALQPAWTDYICSPVLYPDPVRNLRSMSFDGQPLVGMSDERSYLAENLRRQHARGERLSHALHNVETQLETAQSKGEARKLRKEAGLLGIKMAEARKQEELIMLRLNDLQNKDLQYFCQTQHMSWFQYPHSPPQPWGQAQMPPIMPLTPISPLTPLPAGLYSPSLLPPSPLDSPFDFHPTSSTVDLPVPFEQGPHLASLDRLVPVKNGDGDCSVQPGEGRGHHLVAEPVRRWSFADTFSPSPRDKRMSLPGLKSIWECS
jgi:hypothetical protein